MSACQSCAKKDTIVYFLGVELCQYCRNEIDAIPDVSARIARLTELKEQVKLD